MRRELLRCLSCTSKGRSDHEDDVASFQEEKLVHFIITLQFRVESFSLKVGGNLQIYQPLITNTGGLDLLQSTSDS